MLLPTDGSSLSVESELSSAYDRYEFVRCAFVPWRCYNIKIELCKFSRQLGAKLVPTFAGRGCRVVSATDLHGRILGFVDRSRYYFFQVAPQLYSWDWVDPVPDRLLLRKSGSAGNRTRDLWICIENRRRAIESEVVDTMEHSNGRILWWIMNHWVLQVQRND
jgi:hypothetical protein